jgi:glycosyltransferase involved in cell wall biosynthesis
MNIVVLNWQDRTHPQAGGAEVHLHEIFSRIAGMGHSVTLHCCSVPGAPLQETLDGIQVIRSGRRATFNWGVQRWWDSVGKGLRPDVVVDDINKIPFFAPRFVDVPVVGIIHHLFGDSIFAETGCLAGSYVRYFERKIPGVYRNTPIAVVSESTRQECIDIGLPAENLSIIHNAIDQTRFPMRISEKEQRPTVTYFGRIKKYKSVDHLLKAFALVRAKVPEAQLWIMGTGDHTSALQRMAVELEIADATVFWGRVSEEEKSLLLSRSHVVVNTSRKEGWGITTLEANACGTPVISADVPGLRDAVRHNVTGLLYPYGDVNELERHITVLLKNPNLRANLSEGAIQWASTFTWGRSARQMLDLLQASVGRGDLHRQIA